jgi:soluble lytic murein transglycosylase-like protein
MQCSITRYIRAFCLVLALPATSAFAHEHRSEFHHVLYRHHPNYAWNSDVAADQQTSGVPFGVPFSFGAGPSQQWRQPSFNYASQAGGNAERMSAYQGMVAEQASANGVPSSLVDRVVMRESRYNPRAVSRGNYGLMQIRLGTARAMGYGGSAAGLLDPATNMTYAVRYLAGAYRAAGGDENRAVALYARGYYQEAKAQGLTPYGAQAFVR